MCDEKVFCEANQVSISEPIGISLKKRSDEKRSTIINSFMNYFISQATDQMNERADQGFNSYNVTLKPYFQNFINVHKDIRPDIYDSIRSEIITSIIKWASDNDITCTELDGDTYMDIKFAW